MLIVWFHNFCTAKVITSDLQNLCSKKMYIHCTIVLPFYPLLVIFCLQIAGRKVRNLLIGVHKLVIKVSINLLHHTKFITSPKVSRCVITIINELAVAYAHN